MKVGVSKIKFHMSSSHSQEGEQTVFQYISEIEIDFMLGDTYMALVHFFSHEK